MPHRCLALTCALAPLAVLLGCAPPPNLGGAQAGGSSGGDGPLTPLDMAELDRSEAEGACGYPSAGPSGYGIEVGERLANSTNFMLIDCDGNAVELADFFCEREGGGHNRGILLNLGAGWCGPCQEETLEFPELYAEFHDRGIEFVQVMFQDFDSQTPTRGFCRDWTSGNWAVGQDGSEVDVGVTLAFPILLDQAFDWTSIYLQNPESATPVNMLIDANGNIRWKIEGQKPALDTLRTQFELVLREPYAPPS